jgi:protein-disulfide isomerase
MAAKVRLGDVRVRVALAAFGASVALGACGGAPLQPELGRAASSGGAIPLAPDELVLGDPDALVTAVAFVDYASASAGETVAALERARQAAPEALRYVLEPYPSCESAGSREAAIAAAAVAALRGPEAGWRFQQTLLAYPERLTPAFIEQAALDVGVLPAELPRFRDARFAARVDDQILLGRRLGVQGAPVTFVNGRALAGVPGQERLDALVRAELAAAKALDDQGRSQMEVYVARVEQNLRAAAEAAPRESSGVQRVPVAGSATRGLPDARLTLVEFASFTNGCSRAGQASIDRLERTLGARVRRVFKHAALTPAARRAANLAEYARATGGDAKFFEAARLLWQSSPELSLGTLERLARVLGLDVQAALEAVASDRYGERIDADVALASELELERTPGAGLHEPVAFLNGVRVPRGASEPELTALTELLLQQADARIAAGTPPSALYDTLLAQAPSTAAPVPPRELDAEHVPFRGTRGAVVRVEMFASYRSAACSIPDSLQRLFIDHPGRIQLSFRALVSANDAEREQRAAEAGLEAYKQLGNPGFWHLLRLVCSDPGPLSAVELERHAQAVRLDLGRFRAALAERRHQASVEASQTLAARWGFSEGPRFVVNGERLWGEPLRARVERLLGEVQ